MRQGDESRAIVFYKSQVSTKLGCVDNLTRRCDKIDNSHGSEYVLIIVKNNYEHTWKIHLGPEPLMVEYGSPLFIMVLRGI